MRALLKWHSPRDEDSPPRLHNARGATAYGSTSPVLLARPPGSETLRAGAEHGVGIRSAWMIWRRRHRQLDLAWARESSSKAVLRRRKRMVRRGAERIGRRDALEGLRHPEWLQGPGGGVGGGGSGGGGGRRPSTLTTGGLVARGHQAVGLQGGGAPTQLKYQLRSRRRRGIFRA